MTFVDASGDALSSGSLLSDATSLNVGDTLSLKVGSTAGSANAGGFVDIVIGANTTVQSLVDQVNNVAGVRAEFDEKTGSLSIISNDNVYLRTDNAGAATPAPSNLVSVTAANFTAGSQLLKNSGSFNVEDILTLTDGNGYELGSLEVTDKTSVKDLTEFVKRFNGVDASFNTSTGKLTIESDVSLNLKSTNVDFAATTFTADSDGVNVTAAVGSGFATDEAINQTLDKLNNALSVLRSQASEFGTNLSTVQIRQDYTKTMINTLQEGAGKLTLADTNEEGANLLALQTRQQLASTSLSFASQADQTVLSLF